MNKKKHIHSSLSRKLYRDVSKFFVAEETKKELKYKAVYSAILLMYHGELYCKLNWKPSTSILNRTPMFMLGNFLLAIAKLINLVFSAYIWIVIGRAVISWVNADPYNPIVQFLIKATDPVLQKIRRYVPPMGGIDLSPMLLIFAIIFLQSFIVPTLTQIGMNMTLR